MNKLEGIFVIAVVLITTSLLITAIVSISNQQGRFQKCQMACLERGYLNYKSFSKDNSCFCNNDQKTERAY